MTTESAGRRGTILLIVVALSSMVLVLMTGFLARMRATATANQPILREAQCRLMLHAALMYIQEASRLGWGSETYGWTDVRDGSLGPRGPRQPSGTLPEPSWFQGNYKNGFPEDNDLAGGTAGHLPEHGGPSWPMPGAVLRAPMHAWILPPYAVQLRYTPNPIMCPHDPVENMNSYMEFARGLLGRGNVARGIINQSRSAAGNWLDLRDPQPIAHNWPAFQSGVRTERPETTNMAWMRIYRERLEDHDGRSNIHCSIQNRELLPVESGNLVAISQRDGGIHRNKNWNVFVITVGAGGSRGYKNWDEVEAVEATARFGNSRALFEQILRRETRQWWRAEWSAWSGGNFHPDIYDNGLELTSVTDMRRRDRKIYGGGFRFIQRLDTPPPRW